MATEKPPTASEALANLEQPTASKPVPLKEQPTMECSSHGKPLEMYCDTCSKLVCNSCITNTGLHCNHDYKPVADAFPRHQQQIEDSLKQVKKKLAAITIAVQAVKTQEQGFLEQVGAVRTEIEAKVQKLILLLQESERQLMRELDQVTDAYIEKISARKKEADITIAQLKSCKEFAEEELRIGSQEENLVMKGQMVERMAAVSSLDNLQPLEETRVRFVMSTSVLEAWRSVGSVVQFKVAGDKTSFDFSSAALLSSEQVSCQLSPVADSSLVFKCVVHQVTPGSFEIHYSPPTAGVHHLRVQLGGTDIFETPLNVKVIPRKAGKKFTDLYPYGLAFTKEGHLIVAESDKHCITIIDPTDGRKIRSFGEGIDCVQGVAVTQDGRIIAADWTDNHIHVYSAEGVFITYMGESQHLCYPTGVAVHPNGQIFVINGIKYAVMVFNADLTFSHSFGKYGSEPGEFDDARGVAIDADGMVYVADCDNNRVQKLTPEGELLAVIGSKGEGEGQFIAPYGLCVDANGILYVTDQEINKVSMFTSNGKFLRYIGNSDGSSFECPWYIVSDQTGRLYISEDNGVVTY